MGLIPKNPPSDEELARRVSAPVKTTKKPSTKKGD
jgi:hypothetical protein